DLDVTVTQALEIPVAALRPATPAQVGYAEPLPARGGVPPYTWRLVSGALPPGIALGADGVARGNAPAAETLTSATVEVRDAKGFTARREVKMRVAAPRPITPALDAPLAFQ